jgi:AbiV family abortive infection protein
MARSTWPLPPRDDLLRLASAAISNARELLDDARRLVEVRSFPRAHALATFAFEEQGKSQLCLLVWVLPSSIEVGSAPFWDEFYSHRKKIERVSSFDDLFLREPSRPVSEFLEHHVEESRGTHLRKVRGLFVDYEHDHNAVQVPSDIAEQEAVELIDRVDASLRFVEVISTPEMFTALRLLPEFDLGFLQETAQIITAADADAIAARFREVLKAAVAGVMASGLPTPDELIETAPSPDALAAFLRDVLQTIAPPSASEDDSAAQGTEPPTT